MMPKTGIETNNTTVRLKDQSVLTALTNHSGISTQMGRILNQSFSYLAMNSSHWSDKIMASSQDSSAIHPNWVHQDFSSRYNETTATVHHPVTIAQIIVAIFLGVVIITTLFGNILVLLSVALFRKMRTPSHMLIASLATADFLVALLVLPISLYKELTRVWTLGPIICDLWITLDIFCCTASMWNVCIVALDRYWKITRDVQYTHARIFSRNRVCLLMAIMAWTVALIISTSPLFGWRTGQEHADPEVCMVSQDKSYTIFSTFGAFYIPSIAIIAVYLRIYRYAIMRLQARRRSRRKSSVFSSVAQTLNNSDPTQTYPTADSTCTMAAFQSSTTYRKPHKPRESNDRLRRSTTMLGAIIGCFELCWLPFFVIALVAPFCPTCAIPDIIASIALWLGYTNSLLNPIIYAVWNKEFRNAFKQITKCEFDRRLR